MKDIVKRCAASFTALPKTLMGYHYLNLILNLKCNFF